MDRKTHSDRPLTSRNDQVIAKVSAVVMRDSHMTIRKNCERGGHQNFFFTFHSDPRFGYEESDGEIRAEAADGGAKATSCLSLTGYAGLHKQ